MVKPAVWVTGLVDLQQALRAVDRDAPKELRVANLRVAQHVAGRAIARARAIGGPARHFATPRTVKARGEQRRATIKLNPIRGGEGILGAEFGGGRYSARTGPRSHHLSNGMGKRGFTGKAGYTSQFRRWRGNGPDAGYFVYPTLRDRRTARWIEEQYEQTIESLTAKHLR